MVKLCMLLSAFVMICAQTASAGLTNRYVVKNNPGAAAPYDTMANAAGDIQTAIDYVCTEDGSTVLVAAATYDLGGITNLPAGGLLTNRVAITKVITVRSANNDPANTIIKGAWDPATNGPAAVRCVYMRSSSKLIGFTLTNGATSSNGVAGGLYGGGIYAAGSSSIISNCVVIGNVAQRGGGAYGGTLYSCQLIGNMAGYGGGVASATLYGCLVSNNVATNNVAGWSGTAAGGGSYSSPAYNCTIVNNRSVGASAQGGGVWAGTPVSNCLVAFNRATGLGGGVFCDGNNGDLALTRLLDSQVISNTAGDGGGVYRTLTTNCVIAYNTGEAACRPMSLANCLIYGNDYGILIDVAWYAEWIVESCTIVGNAVRGLDVSTGTVRSHNNIIYDNGTGGTNNWRRASGVLTFTNTCTYPVQESWHASNTTNNPRFIANGSGYGLTHVAGNYRLQASSPCINSGTNQAWMTGKGDFDGRMRIRYGTVDMGVYEAIYDRTIYKFR